MTSKMVYFFGAGEAEGDAAMRNLLGGKGANLAEMNKIGLPVPAGFTLTTEVCTHYSTSNESYPDGLEAEVDAAMARVEKVMGSKFGRTDNPLLMSVRSGARVSMPGMMDTVLNLGLNDQTIQGLIDQSGDERFAYDSYRRFVTMFGNVVLGVPHHDFEVLLNQKKREVGKTEDTDMTGADWKDLVASFKAKVLEKTGKPFPEDPKTQLWMAIGAVFSSWMIPRAVTYRRLNGIPEGWGTAVNVQAMVFGNMGEDCATGVAFTRDAASGENTLFGEYLINAQGEDVVAGIRTPQRITIRGKEAQKSELPAMEEAMPELFKEFQAMCHKLEHHYQDMQDVEFTIQSNKLWILQTRSGKRTTKAALKIAVDMVNDKFITKEDAVSRVAPADLDQLLHPMLDPDAEKNVLTTGLPASPGAATGRIYFTPEDAEKECVNGPVLLVRDETSPEDIHGMHAAKGIITSRGGMTSHAAVVARGMGRPCVSGCAELVIDFQDESCTVAGLSFHKGDWLTIDGAKGEVMEGKVPTIEPELSGDFAQYMEWADEIRRMKIRANADGPDDSKVARKFGAEGIGLCRTEHMFFEGDRIIAMREMILAKDEAGRRTALEKILPMQRKDFGGIFRAMRGMPVTIRLLDPPLHEFVPHDEAGQKEVADAMGLPLEEVQARVESLKEFNPMLGHRGCRLGVTYPEIYEIQVKAIMEAACHLVKREGYAIVPEIMIPLVGDLAELSFLKKRVVAVCEEVTSRLKVGVDYLIGTMIELPRAAVTAESIAVEAQFFSFGTNDLTQTALGISRDDAGRFLSEYQEKGLIETDPFASLDQEGVGQLVRLGVEGGRRGRPGIKLGVCGEHGGDPASIHFFESVGLDYVSCSPYRVPGARLAAAQAVLEKEKAG